MKPKQICNITETISETYEAFYNTPMVRKAYSPDKVCSSCAAHLSHWRRNGSTFSIAVPAIWKRCRNHRECYFCNFKLVLQNGTNGKYESKAVYWEGGVVKPQTFAETKRAFPKSPWIAHRRTTRNSNPSAASRSIRATQADTAQQDPASSEEEEGDQDDIDDPEYIGYNSSRRVSTNSRVLRAPPRARRQS